MPYTATTRVSTPLTREWSDWMLNVKGRSPKTVRTHVPCIEQFVGFIEAGTLNCTEVVPIETAPNTDHWESDDELDWGSFTGREFMRFVPLPVANGTRPPSTSMKRKRVAVLKSFYKFLRMVGVVSTDVTEFLDGPSFEQSKPKPLSDDALLSLWGSARSLEERVCIGLGAFASLRAAEMVDLELRSIDTSSRSLVDFFRKGDHDVPKGRVEYGRYVDQVSGRLPQLAAMASDWEDTMYRFASVRHKLDAALLLTYGEGQCELPSLVVNKRLSVSSGGTVTPHMLRHTFGTNGFRAGIPLAMMADSMGHKKPETTMIYTDTTAGYHGEIQDVA